ncbi:sialin-like [Planococcus citri]|uniref:sialin-like n=1 Tax=Planococcus citri TaxID=170843 RepID=UPI0031F96817
MGKIISAKKLSNSDDQRQLHDDSFSENDSKSKPAQSLWFSKRFFVGLVMFFGFLMYSMACQVINIALVEMTIGKIQIKGNQTIIQPPQFHWDSEKISMILNMFWYGFLFSTVGGYLSQRFGGVTIVGISLLSTGIITIFNPITVQWGFYPFLISRALVGLFESFTSASFSEVFARWVPKKERSKFIPSIMNGMYVGTALTYPLCGYLAHNWKWPMTFYVIGALCVVWSVLCLLLVRNSPSADKRISKKELDYILQGTSNPSTRKVKLPNKMDIVRCLPVWALSMGKFAFNWCSAFTVVYLPLYIKDATQRNISEIGLLALIPNISIFLIPAVGMLVNYWQNHTTLTITQIHKTIISGGYLLAALLFAVSALSDHFTVSIICFVLIKLLLSCNKIFLEVITVNMAPNHSGLLSGLSLFWQTNGIIVAQTIVGYVVKNHRLQEWNVCFLLSSCISLITAIIFVMFGSSEPQQWSVISLSENNGETNQKNENPIK